MLIAAKNAKQLTLPQSDFSNEALYSPTTAAGILADWTGKPWTTPRLLQVAIALGWRQPTKGHKAKDFRFYKTFNEATGMHYERDAYTSLAIQVIINDPEGAWALSQKKAVTA